MATQLPVTMQSYSMLACDNISNADKTPTGLDFPLISDPCSNWMFSSAADQHLSQIPHNQCQDTSSSSSLSLASSVSTTPLLAPLTAATNTTPKSREPTQEELRLQKRKEQNKRAQRAYRDRQRNIIVNISAQVETLQRYFRTLLRMHDLLCRRLSPMEEAFLAQPTKDHSLPTDQSNAFSIFGDMQLNSYDYPENYAE